MKKPIINLDELENFEESSEGKYAEKYAAVSNHIGAKKLGYSLSIVPPGKRVCPFHNHHVNEEMFLILEGEGTLRFGDKEFPVKKNDVIACPPGGREVAHQIINTSDKELKYFCLSTNEEVDICEYPDSNKVMAMAGEQGKRSFRYIVKANQEVDYLEGER